MLATILSTISTIFSFSNASQLRVIASSQNGYVSYQDIKYLKQQGANLNNTDDKNCTLIYKCCYYSNEVEALELLLSSGADPNICNHKGESPLMHACNRGQLEFVKVLVNKGADVNIQAKDGYSALLGASRTGSRLGNPNMVRVLLESNANPNVAIFDSGETPLHAASSIGNLQIVMLLVQYGADVNAISNGLTPLNYGIRHKQVEMFLINNGGTINLRAVNNLDDFEYIVDNIGVDNYYSDDENNILLHATQLKSLRSINALLEMGVNPNLRPNEKVMTPLHACLYLGKVGIVRKFLRFGADVNAVYVIETASIVARKTPLHIAIELNKNEIVKVLLEGGANLENLIIFEHGKDVNYSIYQYCRKYNSYGLEYLWLSHSPATHKQFPCGVRYAIVCCMLVAKRNNWGLDNTLLHKIFSYAAFDWK